MSVQDDLLRAAEHVAAEIEGFKVEVVEDRIVMTPQSHIQSWTILDVQVAAMSAGVRKERLLSDVLIDFPGESPRAPDVAIVEEGARAPFSHDDLLAAVEIVSSENDSHDYVLKLGQYARFGVPLYLVVDPFRGECTLYARPADGKYAKQETFRYGETITLRLADGSAVELPTADFRRKD
ncbi:Uma2 family endonuclease [Streptomyces sp. B1866]|uniref:Uma2 family endonuclease n=1 Tax=Streptomyces sp. B1866 TaxID=3075431 RepID=UPI00288FE2A0|nr:Uma2 family endonuclease [Streptomyces sp. B1866]MDT3398445.1 Uma2 family endonuclease [Streptomyces sp. B1866]